MAKRPRIAVVTDSAACLPTGLVKRYHIHVVPFSLISEGKVYRDGIDISPSDFYAMFRQANSLPTTSQPSLEEFASLYEMLSRTAQGIVSIHIPAELSGTVEVARLAAQKAASVPFHIIDARTATMAEGFVVLEAARCAEQGHSLEEVADCAERVIARVDLFATLEDLKYVHRGGRIGEAARLVGSQLKISPVLHLRDGEVKVAAVVRTRRKALLKILELTRDRVGNTPIHVSVFHGDAPREAAWMEERVRAQLNCVEFYLTEFTPVMGGHSGPGVVGLAFYSD